jgi:hypothetical protein
VDERQALRGHDPGVTDFMVFLWSEMDAGGAEP